MRKRTGGCLVAPMRLTHVVQRLDVYSRDFGSVLDIGHSTPGLGHPRQAFDHRIRKPPARRVDSTSMARLTDAG